MAEFNIVLSDKQTGKSHKLTAADANANAFIGKRIGEEVAGDALGLSGYTIKITGGSDKGGFPMRATLPGELRKKILVKSGQGYRQTEEGMKKRRTMRGNEIADDIAQINAIVTEYGTQTIDEILGGGAEEKTDEAAEE